MWEQPLFCWCKVQGGTCCTVQGAGCKVFSMQVAGSRVQGDLGSPVTFYIAEIVINFFAQNYVLIH